VAHLPPLFRLSHAPEPTRQLADPAERRVAKLLLTKVPAFTDLTEKQRSTISNRSTKLFTLSGIYHATQALLADHGDHAIDARVELAAGFWNEVAKHIRDWGHARERKVSAAELRRDFVHAHALALAALARVGRDLLRCQLKDWRGKLTKLGSLDWSRGNTDLWEGRALSAGRISKRTANVTLTGNAIKRHLALATDEQQLEDEFNRSRNARVK
jgi:DNA sulfur modification protein DndB